MNDIIKYLIATDLVVSTHSESMWWAQLFCDDGTSSLSETETQVDDINLRHKADNFPEFSVTLLPTLWSL